MQGKHFMLPEGTLSPDGTTSALLWKDKDANIASLPLLSCIQAQQRQKGRADPAFPLRTAWLTW